MAILTLLLPVYRTVDKLAFRNKLFNFLVTGGAQLSRLIANVVGEIGAVRIMAFKTVIIHRWMDVASLPVTPDLFFVTSLAELHSPGNKQLWLPRRMRLMAQDTCSRSHGAVHTLFVHE